MAVDGVFSHWITDDILAMARPNTGGLLTQVGGEGLLFLDDRRHSGNGSS
jgi:hypothetical protein